MFWAVPKVQFKDGRYQVDESDGEVKAIVHRSGDISVKSTVRCYTRQGTAQVMMDYSERPNTDASVITFLPGQAQIRNSDLRFSAEHADRAHCVQVRPRSPAWSA